MKSYMFLNYLVEQNVRDHLHKFLFVQVTANILLNIVNSYPNFAF